MKFAISYSCGKDSALSLYRMMREGHTPVCLVVTVNQELGRSWFHGADCELLAEMADCLHLPLLQCVCMGGNYQQAFEKCLVQAREMGAEACVFGDIDIEQHREWDEERCKAAGLQCILPLWESARADVVSEFVESGLKGVIKSVQNCYIGKDLLGREINRETIEAIKATGADACGENGEYHTIVYDGPIFMRPAALRFGKIIDFGSHSVIDITVKK